MVLDIERLLILGKFLIFTLGDNLFSSNILVIPTRPIERECLLITSDRIARILQLVEIGINIGTVALLIGLKVHHQIVIRSNWCLCPKKLCVALASLVHPHAFVALCQFQGSKQQGGMQEYLGHLTTILVVFSILFLTPSLFLDFTATLILCLTGFIGFLDSLLLGLCCLLPLFIHGGLLFFDDRGGHLFGYTLGYMVRFHNMFSYTG